MRKWIINQHVHRNIERNLRGVKIHNIIVSGFFPVAFTASSLDLVSRHLKHSHPFLPIYFSVSQEALAICVFYEDIKATRVLAQNCS